MAEVRFEKATRIYSGTTAPAVNALDLDVKDGEFLVLVGPSGSGKSTALRMLAGIEPADRGRIFIGDRDVTKVPPRHREIAMVCQSYALYPQMTVAENMGFALKMAKVPKVERIRRVLEAARILDLEPYLDRKPKQLSGGQRQRVAMGRAIVRQPLVYLMDEPLSNLDAKLRVQTRTEISAMQARLGVTTVYVTHDQVEAMTMGDRVAVLKDGILQQVASPREVYDRPINLFVAGFIGSPAMNLISLPVIEDSVLVGGATVRLPRTTAAGIGERGLRHVFLGIRPEHVSFAGEGIAGEVHLVEELGSDAFVHVNVAGLDRGDRVVVRVTGARPPERGANVALNFNGPLHIFATDGERLGE